MGKSISKITSLSGDLLLQGSVLSDIIDVEYGLTDELLGVGLLNQQQIELINSERTLRGKVSQLLNDVTSMSHNEQEQFLSILDRTNQSHVANFIRYNGQRPKTDPDNWPIYPFSQWAKIQENWSQLVELIDTCNGLLHELWTDQCINSRQREAVDNIEAEIYRNQTLLDITKRKSVTDFNKFVDCLVRTKQHYVAWLLNPSRSQNGQQPLTEQQKATLETNYSVLVDQIQSKSTLVADLCSADCITKQQKQFIESASEANKRLLDVIKQSTQTDFHKFINYLCKTRQKHVAYTLLKNGVIAQIVVKTNVHSEDEILITELFSTLFADTPTHYAEELHCKLQPIFEMLEDNRLLAMRAQNGVIKLFILCRSLPGLMHLRELFSTGQLTTIIQCILTTLFSNKQLVTAEKLVWDTSDYNNCIQHLSNLFGLIAYSRIHQLQRLSLDVTADAKMSTVGEVSVLTLLPSTTVHQLPHELIEKLLLKAAGQLFVMFNKLTTRSDVYTLLTLGTVSCYWLETLTSRLSYKRMALKHFFTHVCHPYRLNSQLVSSFNIDGNDISNVAELNSKLYVAVASSNTVRALAINSAYSRITDDDIKVPGLKNSHDVVVCGVTKCMYISDMDSRCVWRVNLAPSSPSEVNVYRFVATKYSPHTLSLQSTRLLVTSYAGDALYVYNSDSQERKHVRLEHSILATHSLESAHGTFIVSHRARFITDTHPGHTGVSEITDDGKILRFFNMSSVTFTTDCYLTSDLYGNILVSDQLQILLLNSELVLKQVLITLHSTVQPTKMCYSYEKGLLYICHYTSNISVYAVAAKPCNISRDQLNP